jgi:CheY-like chemotaxis protein
MENLPRQPRQRLLIIDDNPTIHEDIKKILIPPEGHAEVAKMATLLFGPDSSADQVEHDKFQIDSAFQGQEGLALVEKAIAEGDPYSLAFVDVRMPPGWDGIETVRRIWEKYPDLQVIICTAYSDHSWDHIVGQLGHSDNLVILKKPFDNVEVLQLAHSLTKKWALTRAARAREDDLNEMVRAHTEALRKANEQLQAEVRQRRKVEAQLRAAEERSHKASRKGKAVKAVRT